MFNIKDVTQKLLKGCIIRSNSGINMYTPDGKGNYAALWTRDFAYMVEYAGELIPEEDIINGIEYLIYNADKNGWMPDRVTKEGIAIYTAGTGNFCALPNLDNGCFAVLAADAFLKTLDVEKAKSLFLKWKDALIKGIDCIPIDDKGFIINRSNPPHSPYGFTDTVVKTGILCFETLLLWRAKKAMIEWLEKTDSDAEIYIKSIKSIEKYFADVFMGENGMLVSATEQCCKTDIWASCFAVSIDFPLTKSEKTNIARWLINNYDSIVESGQIRHLPSGEYWDKTFVPIDIGTYQNGAYWATPTGWFVDAIIEYDKLLAVKTVKDILKYFEKYGVFECVNGEYRNLDTYVASATNVYGICKKYNIYSN